MRNPKYRAWDTKRKKMWSAEELGRDQLTLSPDGKGFINVSSVSTSLSNYLPHLIPRQYTGEQDKHGKDIYQGDLVQNDIKDWCGCVIFQDGRFLVQDEVGLRELKFPAGTIEDEVVGNKYENPEMLKEATE